MKIKIKRKEFSRYFLVLAIIILPTFLYTGLVFGQNTTGNSSVETLNEDIKGIKDKIKELEAEKDQYEDEIDSLRGQRLSLSRELDILNNRIAQKEIEIVAEQARIDQTTLEIQVIDDAIRVTENEISTKKNQLGNVLDKLDREGETDYFQIFLLNDSFTDFFDDLKSLENIQGDVYQLLTDVQNQKLVLEEEQVQLEEKKDFQEQLKMKLEEKKISLEDQKNTKDFLIAQTRYSERQFQGLIAEIKKEQQAANNDIISLEQEIRAQLAQDQLLSTLGGDEEFHWPVGSRLITAYFHDPSYPYRYVFEHPAIDIAVPQGTPIKATKSGYIGRAKDAGLGYSYIMILHDDGMSSVYGHISSILVHEDDFVVQGQTIGLSGGAPGTPGAGNLSTGSHLHFELRQDGVPVNPLNYLN